MVDSIDEGQQVFGSRLQHVPLPQQRFSTAIARSLHDALDLVESKAQLCEEEHLLETLDLFHSVGAIAGRRPTSGNHKTDFIVVMQCPHRNPREPGKPADCQHIHGSRW